MAEERFLVTGAFGCIGAWTTKRLVAEGATVFTYDLPGNPHRLRLIMDDKAFDQVNILEGDITDQARFEQVVVDNGISYIIHLAAFQVPFVRADPIQGARVNVVGTTIVFETARQHADQVRGLVYASSIGVYGPANLYSPGPLAHDAPLAPPTLYGVTKQANEGMARIYWQDWQVRSTGLRPFYVYGPGRDQGVSSTPTKAMLAAAVGRPYHISFGGTAVYQHADDAAKAFIHAVRTPLDGAPVFNLGGSTASMADVVQAIEAAVPEMAGKITFEPAPMPYPTDVDRSAIEAALGDTGWRPFDQGVRETIEHFRAAAADGRLDVERAIA
jgi:UDP-glucuronate 4-epimerase